MIDWLLVARHGLWICGAAVVVAGWSYGRTEGYDAKCRAFLFAGALLFCIGLALVTPPWQAWIWAALAILAAWQAFGWRRRNP